MVEEQQKTMNLVPEKSCGFGDRSLGCGLACTLDFTLGGPTFFLVNVWIGGGDTGGVFPEPD